MTVAPARIAGVERIIVATPPGRETLIDPAVAYAAKAAGATDILTVGGAQAVAALAFGTKRIPRAAAIVGPGNAYVTAAKRIVNAMVWTDAPAGPSELLVLADDTADARLIALDMVAQAEHDPEAQVVLVSTDADLPARVHEHVDTLLVDHPRQEIVETSLTDKGVALIVEDVDAAIGFADDYAAEHVEVHMADARLVADRLRHAGSIFIGPHAPVPVGDYGSGTNHVLPTMGFARTRGGLSVEDFRKWVTYQELSAEGLAGIADDVATLADAEGLAGHAQAIRDRLEGA